MVVGLTEIQFKASAWVLSVTDSLPHLSTLSFTLLSFNDTTCDSQKTFHSLANEYICLCDNQLIT